MESELSGEGATPGLLAEEWMMARTNYGVCEQCRERVPVEHVIRDRVDAAHVLPLLKQTAEADGREVRVGWEQEGGAQGKIVSATLAGPLAGFPFEGVAVHKDKVVRAQPFLDQARVGNVRLVSGPWIAAWLDELCAFPMGAHDDQMDSVSGAFAALTVKQFKQPGAASYV